jgi:hypothetical protein
MTSKDAARWTGRMVHAVRLQRLQWPIEAARTLGIAQPYSASVSPAKVTLSNKSNPHPTLRGQISTKVLRYPSRPAHHVEG